MIVLPSVATGERSQLPLNGQWMFAPDPHDTGAEQGWYSRDFSVLIQVPGSWEEQGFGELPDSHPLTTWSKKHQYEGAAWYSRMIDIPAGWQGRTLELVLKGVRWTSRVWLDGQSIGEQISLSTPHRYDLTGIVQPGIPARLTIRIDNRMVLPLGESHINSYQTATQWGGITGGIELTATSKTAIQQVQCRRNIAEKRFNFDLIIVHPSDNLKLTVALKNPATGHITTAETIFYSVTSLFVVVPLALLEALALNSKLLKFRTFWRAIYFAPIVTSTVAVSLVFRMMYNREFGVINNIILAFGGAPVDWLGTPAPAKIAVMGIVVWRWTGLLAVYFLAGLQSTSEVLYEAASIDGANASQKFLYITLPSLRPVILFVSVIVLIGSMQIFDDPQILTGGGPANASLSIVQYLYIHGVTNQLFGFASAVGLFLFVIIFVLSLEQFRVFRGFGND